MSDPTSATQPAEMAQAGLRFVEQFEMQRVLAAFENELRILAGQTNPQAGEPEQASSGR